MRGMRGTEEKKEKMVRRGSSEERISCGYIVGTIGSFDVGRWMLVRF